MLFPMGCFLVKTPTPQSEFTQHDFRDGLNRHFKVMVSMFFQEHVWHMILGILRLDTLGTHILAIRTKINWTILCLLVALVVGYTSILANTWKSGCQSSIY